MHLIKWIATTLTIAMSLNAIGKDNVNSLCIAGEKVLFSCTVRGSNKVVSLCASKTVTRNQGYVKYRFGNPSKIEMEFPRSSKDTQEQFKYAHYFRYQVDHTEISFDVNQYKYSLFDAYEGDEKVARQAQGVRVELPTKENRELLCESHVMGNLNEAEPLIACDENNALNLDGCPAK